jgi:hypothetical protein
VWLPGAAVDAFAGLLHVLAQTVGRVAANSNQKQEASDEHENNDAFNKCDPISAWLAVAYSPIV